MNGTGWAVVIVILIVLAGGVWWYTQNPVAPEAVLETGQPADATPQEGQATTTPGSSSAPMSATVAYTASGFSPATVTIAKGGTVTFINQSGRSMWVASNEHPTHEVYDGTGRSVHCAAGYTGAKPFDECASGASYSYTFSKNGSFNYHNHTAAQDGGQVVVQ